MINIIFVFFRNLCIILRNIMNTVFSSNGITFEVIEERNPSLQDRWRKSPDSMYIFLLLINNFNREYIGTEYCLNDQVHSLPRI